MTNIYHKHNKKKQAFILQIFLTTKNLLILFKLLFSVKYSVIIHDKYNYIITSFRKISLKIFFFHLIAYQNITKTNRDRD